MPLANAFLTQERLNEPEPTYPLEVVFCSSCSLVQLTVSVPPEQIFREYLLNLLGYNGSAISGVHTTRRTIHTYPFRQLLT